MTIANWIYQWAKTERIAFRFEGDEVSYGQLAQRIDDVSAGLVAAGVAGGDRVGFCGLNRIELFELLFASARIGAIFVPFNNRLTTAELAVLIEDADPSILLATDGFDSTLKQASGGRRVEDLDTNPFGPTETDLPPGPQPHLHPPRHDSSALDDSPVLMVYTSGTTGKAKGAMLSHRAMVHTVLNSVDHQGLTGADRIIAPLPTFHVGGLNIQTLPTLFVGGEVLLQRRFDPAGLLDLIAEHRPTQTLLVPAMLDAVAAQPAFVDTDLSTLRGINSGSSIVPVEVMAPFFERGVPVGQVYGTTETGPTAVVLGYEEAAAKQGSCGRPAAHTEVRIVDETGADLDDGETGELWVRGANVFLGYWRNASATAEAFADGDWFRTGDVAFRSPDGYLYICDRIKDVVISGGENIYPAEIEPVLARHPAIVEVTVIGQPDQRWGEVPVAIAVLNVDHELDIDELRTWCESRLARYKQPRALVLVDQLPRTALGKVKKHELRSRNTSHWRA